MYPKFERILLGIHRCSLLQSQYILVHDLCEFHIEFLNLRTALYDACTASHTPGVLVPYPHTNTPGVLWSKL